MDAIDAKNLAILKRTWARSMTGRFCASRGRDLLGAVGEDGIAAFLRSMRRHS